MDLFTLKKKFKQHNNFLKIFNHNKKAKQEFQRLEFLGDRVLALILSHEIYNRFTKFNEGRLATIFSYLTSSTTLSKIAKNIQLDLFIKKKMYNGYIFRERGLDSRVSWQYFSREKKSQKKNWNTYFVEEEKPNITNTLYYPKTKTNYVYPDYL